MSYNDYLDCITILGQAIGKSSSGNRYKRVWKIFLLVNSEKAGLSLKRGARKL